MQVFNNRSDHFRHFLAVPVHLIEVLFTANMKRAFWDFNYCLLNNKGYPCNTVSVKYMFDCILK